jgi:hypothetical protein
VCVCGVVVGFRLLYVARAQQDNTRREEQIRPQFRTILLVLLYTDRHRVQSSFIGTTTAVTAYSYLSISALYSIQVLQDSRYVFRDGKRRQFCLRGRRRGISPCHNYLTSTSHYKVSQHFTVRQQVTSRCHCRGGRWSSRASAAAHREHSFPGREHRATRYGKETTGVQVHIAFRDMSFYCTGWTYCSHARCRQCVLPYCKAAD